MTGSRSHILCFSQSVVEPTLNPFWATNQASNCSFPWSHPRPPSSQASFQNPTANFTDSIVSLELRATVRPSLSTSLPPHAHMNEYQNTGASPKVWPAVWPIGYPLTLSFVPTSRYCCHVFG